MVDIPQTSSRPAPRSGDPTLASLIANGRQNAFDALRLVLSLAVVYSHAFRLGGFGPEGFQRFCKFQTDAGAVGVMGFFGISGFLISRSFSLSENPWKFIRSRALRILPGLYFALLLIGFVVAPLIGRFNPHSGGWSAGEAFGFFYHNALVRVRQWLVGGVLQGLPYDESIDGSLWSLYPEMWCYGLVLVAGLLGAIRARPLNMVLLAAITLAVSAATVLAPDAAAASPTFLRLIHCGPHMACFAVGAALYCARDHVEVSLKSALFWWLATGVLAHFGGWAIAGPLVLTMALIQTAFVFVVRLPFDLSYGTYLLHFAIFDLLAALGVQSRGWLVFLLCALALTLPLAALSWFAVERPFLRLKRR